MWKCGVRKAWILSLVVSFLSLGFVQNAAAGMIGTQTALQTQEQDLRMARIQAALAREDVREQMVLLGVDPVQAEERVAALTEEELLLLEHELAQLPAGGSFFAVVGVVFVVLLILEITGVTDIFKAV